MAVIGQREIYAQISTEFDTLPKSCVSKMDPKKNNRLLTKVAVLYFENSLSHREIADRLGLSRQTVGRLLRRAKEAGIVRIEVHSPSLYASELEFTLEQTFQLLEVIVISPPTTDDEVVKRTIGRAGAEFLQRRVRNKDIIGVSAGSTTIYQCAIRLKPAHLPELTVVSLNGDGPHSEIPAHLGSIAHRMGSALGGKTIVLPAPTFVDRVEIKERLLSDANIAEFMQLAYQANVAVVGIGAISEKASPYQHGYVDQRLLETLKREHCVGEICGHAYNLDGELCSPELSGRAVGIDLTSLRSKPLSVALAGGRHKLDAIWGALQGRYCNVLITDEDTARALLKRKTGA